ncbi:MAG: hypothetical protein IT544_05970 [Rhodobacteraceae bacterium]|nr:hypothetical protein [Paracoccaceae bacterium]
MNGDLVLVLWFGGLLVWVVARVIVVTRGS